MLSEYFIGVLSQKYVTRLSVAVCLTDDFTGKHEINGDIEVSIPALNATASMNPSGYHDFLNIPDGTYTFDITSMFYLKEKIDNVVIPRNTSYSLATHVPHDSTSAKLNTINGLYDGDVLEFDNGSDPPERRTIRIDTDPATKTVHWNDDPRGGVSYDYLSGDAVSLPHPFNFVLPVFLKPNHLYSFPSGTTLIRSTLLDVNDNPIADAKIEVVGKNIETRTSDTGDFVLYFPVCQGDDNIQIKVIPLGGTTFTTASEVKKGEIVTLLVNYP